MFFEPFESLLVEVNPFSYCITAKFPSSRVCIQRLKQFRDGLGAVACDSSGYSMVRVEDGPLEYRQSIIVALYVFFHQYPVRQVLGPVKRSSDGFRCFQSGRNADATVPVRRLDYYGIAQLPSQFPSLFDVLGKPVCGNRNT